MTKSPVQALNKIPPFTKGPALIIPSLVKQLYLGVPFTPKAEVRGLLQFAEATFREEFGPQRSYAIHLLARRLGGQRFYFSSKRDWAVTKRPDNITAFYEVDAEAVASWFGAMYHKHIVERWVDEGDGWHSLTSDDVLNAPETL